MDDDVEHFPDCVQWCEARCFGIVRQFVPFDEAGSRLNGELDAPSAVVIALSAVA